MAKLNVTIPAVDAMVNGQAYRKVDRKAQAGDIVKFTDGALPSFVTDGAFYAVDRVDGAGDAHITDNDGDGYDTAGDSFEVYAPLSVDPPVAPSDELTFGGATYRKVDRPACEGDVIVITKVVHPRYEQRVTVGNAYMVTEVDDAGDAQIADNNGRDYDTSGDTFDVYEKVAQPPAQAPDMPPVEYREVIRWAEKGERIRIVNRHPNEHRYEQGAEFVVNSVDGDGDVRVTLGDSDRKLVVLSEYVVLEPTAAQAPAQPKRYAACDYVKVTGNSVGHGYADGSVVKIAETKDNARHGGQQFRAEKADGEVGNWLVTDDVEPADEAGFEAQKPAELEAGDLAKIARARAEVDSSDIPYRAEKVDGSDYDWFCVGDLEKLTVEEAAAIEKEAQETAKQDKLTSIVRNVQESGIPVMEIIKALVA
jgi:hypothetical protein